MRLKKLFLDQYILIIIAFVFFGGTLSAKETYTIANSKALQFIYFVSGVPISGEFYIDRTSFRINFKEEDKSRFNIKIDIAKSTAGFPLATTAMLGSTVLNAKKFPFMEFTSTNILKKEERYEVRGLLSLRGIKKKVTLFVYSEERYKKDANILKFRIESSINRHDFGASGYSFLVGKEIKLNSNIELIKEK